ncbi:MAG: hypothetical protein KGL10_04930 [Alphaproteobacteria bacterium]|nr:hypothetical protein [Alphaproteobacteria bacterium]MDE2336635.1 hypothetical protein [Alphaproteobacteria bacterium]
MKHCKDGACKKAFEQKCAKDACCTGEKKEKGCCAPKQGQKDGGCCTPKDKPHKCG